MYLVGTSVRQKKNVSVRRSTPEDDCPEKELKEESNIWSRRKSQRSDTGCKVVSTLNTMLPHWSRRWPIS